MNGGSCDDLDDCSYDDLCSGGTCAGTPYSCVDGPICTDDICHGDGTCSNPEIDVDTDGYGLCGSGDPVNPDGNDADRDDGNTDAWAVPGEVLDIVLSDKATLDWSPSSDLGGTSVVYDTIRSEDPGDFVTAAVCVESDAGPDTTADVSPDPGAAIVYYFLTRAENTCPSGVGTLGTDSDSVDRSGRNCP
jgi:hypothetical protein